MTGNNPTGRLITGAQEEKGELMINTLQLTRTIKSVFPDIAECDIEVKVLYKKEEKTWMVALEKDDLQQSVDLGPEEVEECRQGKKCFGLVIPLQKLIINSEKGGKYPVNNNRVPLSSAAPPAANPLDTL